MTRSVHTLRLAAFALAAALFFPASAGAQFATAPGYTAGTVGGACNTGTQAFAWPDADGHVIQCVSSLWTAVSDAIWSVTGSNIYYNAGNVGIGTTGPAATLEIGSHLSDPNGLVTASGVQINDAPTATAVAYQESLHVVNVPTVGGNSSAYNVAIAGVVAPPANSYNYNLEYGGDFGATFAGSGTLTAAYSVSSLALNAGGGTVSVAIGVNGVSENSSTGTITAGYGVNGAAINFSSGTTTITQGGQFYAENYSTGTMTTALGVYAFTQNYNAGGHVTNAYAGYFDDGARIGYTNAGTVTNGYGVYIGTIYGTTNYGLYQANSANQNYFAGKVGIGTATPLQLLHVYTATTSAIVADFQNGTGVCTFAPTAGATSFSCSSDARLKKDIVDTGPALPGLGDMRVRDYTVRSSNERLTGVIAQELIKTHPDMVHVGPKGYYTVDQPNPWKLVKAIQELKALFGTDHDQIEKLKAANDSDHDVIEKIKAANNTDHDEIVKLKAANDNQAAEIGALRDEIAALKVQGGRR